MAAVAGLAGEQCERHRTRHDCAAVVRPLRAVLRRLTQPDGASEVTRGRRQPRQPHRARHPDGVRVGRLRRTHRLHERRPGRHGVAGPFVDLGNKQQRAALERTVAEFPRDGERLAEPLPGQPVATPSTGDPAELLQRGHQAVPVLGLLAQLHELQVELLGLGVVAVVEQYIAEQVQTLSVEGPVVARDVDRAEQVLHGLGRPALHQPYGSQLELRCRDQPGNVLVDRTDRVRPQLVFIGGRVVTGLAGQVGEVELDALRIRLVGELICDAERTGAPSPRVVVLPRQGQGTALLIAGGNDRAGGRILSHGRVPAPRCGLFVRLVGGRRIVPRLRDGSEVLIADRLADEVALGPREVETAPLPTLGLVVPATPGLDDGEHVHEQTRPRLCVAEPLDRFPADLPLPLEFPALRRRAHSSAATPAIRSSSAATR